eukprot:TRINITY_DN2820_c0_g1_i1.p1 TRINITY_DN2820_c0_g1~~TRINITY_DN2820_c0_g1_i1.p1  ORF type:complete len:372 (+),score=35.66 TRINITY_DN2820_c0_g1_i1:213-1328(+)
MDPIQAVGTLRKVAVELQQAVAATKRNDRELKNKIDTILTRAPAIERLLLDKRRGDNNDLNRSFVLGMERVVDSIQDVLLVVYTWLIKNPLTRMASAVEMKDALVEAHANVRRGLDEIVALQINRMDTEYGKVRATTLLRQQDVIEAIDGLHIVLQNGPSRSDAAMKDFAKVGLAALKSSKHIMMAGEKSVESGSAILDLSDYQLSGSIPPQLCSLTNLRELYLSVNLLSGCIPPQLSALTNLTELHLYYNRLSGSIPPQLSALTNLRVLSLHNNQLSGSIPPQLSTLTNLTVLSLSCNQLSGNIPPQLSALTNLTKLCLCKNRLSGIIPPQLSALTKLKVLSLHSNQLHGSFPPQLSALLNQNLPSIATS